jgi:outer membrane protein assembly factor BamA
VKVITLILCLFVPAGTNLLAQELAPKLDLEFSGNTVLSSSALRSAVSEVQSGVYRPGIELPIQNALLERYYLEGYYFADVASFNISSNPDSTEFLARIAIVEGGQLLVDSIAISGNDSIPRETLLEEMDIQPGDAFSQQLLEQDILRMLEYYENNGYPFASIEVQDIALRQDSAGVYATLLLQVDEDAAFFVDEIRVQGNEITNADVIVRETRIERGEKFNAEKMGVLRRRVERLNFFSSVSEPKLYRRNGKGGLLLNVKEGNTTLIDGIIGYQPPGANESAGYVTGLVNLSFRNLFGTGRRVDARWERATREVTELELRYLEPWIFALPISMAGGYFQRQQDSSYLRRTMDAKMSYLATSDISVSTGVQYAQVIPAAVSTTVNVLDKSTTLSGSLELLIDTRNDIFNPMAGVLMRNYYSGGNKNITSRQTGLSSSDFVQHIEIDLSYFQLLFPRNILVVSIHGRELKGNELDVSDYYRLGGANSLRGYREEQFTGTRLAWTSAEYRFSLGRRSFAFAFYDFGYISQPANEKFQIPAFDETRTGYGIGGRLETGLGVMGVSYALGKGDSFSTGKIHFGLITEF